MVIKNLKNEYEVIQRRKSFSGHTIYKCQTCELIQLNHMAQNKDIIAYFNSVLGKGLWEDLIECFVQYDNLYIAVKSYEADKLYQQIKCKNFSLPERVSIFEHLCEKIVLQNMPCYSMYDGLRKEHVLLSERLEVFMQYGMEHILQYAEYTMEDVCRQLSFWLKCLFDVELKRKASNQLVQFHSKLKKDGFGTYTEIYQAYKGVGKELIQLHDSGELLLHNTLPYRIWNKTRKFFDKMKYIFLVFLFIAMIVISFIYYQNHIEKINTSVPIVDFIGAEEVGGS